MKKIFYPLALLAFVSTSALAAAEIKESDAAGMKYVGMINLVATAGIMSDYLQTISQRADERGADYFVITGMDSIGNGNENLITATLYKK